MSNWSALEPIALQAETAIRTEDFEQAAALLRRLVSMEPMEPLFHWRLGYVLMELQNHSDALMCFHKAIALDPDSVPAWGGLGRVYLEKGDFREAESAFRKRLSLRTSIQHYVFLALALREMGRYQESVEACKAAINIDPKYDEAYFNLGLALDMSGRHEEAKIAIEKAESLDPSWKTKWLEYSAL
jgi:protein O-GlcNAc transferase